MPLFQDSDRRSWSSRSGDRCQDDQSVVESPRHEQGKENHQESQSATFKPVDWQASSTEHSPTRIWRGDERQELIQRIKESSPWRTQLYETQDSDSSSRACRPHSSLEEPKEENRAAGSVSQSQPYPYSANPTEELGSPADIQRPRSALHSGDFREGTANALPQSPRPRFTEPSPASPFPQLGTSPTTPWFGGSHFPTPSTPINASRAPQSGLNLQTRSRAPSLGSFSSSYVLKVPTSPLVHQANNTDLDFSPVDSGESLGPTDRANRRRTLPPETFRHLQGSPPSVRTVNLNSPCSSGGHDGLFQSQYSHRRSLTSAYSLQLASTTNAAAYHRARRSSLASDSSPKPHAPLVGSYEESILRGRMSMNPSKPLDFTAQIGVLGKGTCKGHLKCPPHVTIPFPAVFYSYPTSGSGRSISDDRPSPYVGQIDIENSLPVDDSRTAKRRKRHLSPMKASVDVASDGTITPRATDAESRRRREKKSRRAASPKCPPGGSYRIPQKGQLQIIIKNPHKTAVKLFLVPYDLSDMEPGTKTFIRQRSYSAGPIIDMPLSARKNYGTDRPEASLNATENPDNKPTLRYLIHINICCPSRGRFYIHSSVRVVFANRVPDGKEKLRNEIQLAEPRYSPYKPTREPNHTASTTTRLAIEGASRRRSMGQGPIPLLRQNVSAPSGEPMKRSVAEFMELDESLLESQPCAMDPYNKLSKGDTGYGGHLASPGVSHPDTGESLLAKRLRGLDVHRKESFDRN